MYGDSAWKGKPSGVLGISVGAPGTSMAQQHLRDVLAYLNMPTLGQPEIFMQVREGMFADGRIANEDTRGFLQSWVDAYSVWVKQLAHCVPADSNAQFSVPGGITFIDGSYQRRDVAGLRTRTERRSADRV